MYGHQTIAESTTEDDGLPPVPRGTAFPCLSCGLGVMPPDARSAAASCARGSQADDRRLSASASMLRDWNELPGRSRNRPELGSAAGGKTRAPAHHADPTHLSAESLTNKTGFKQRSRRLKVWQEPRTRGSQLPLSRLKHGKRTHQRSFLRLAEAWMRRGSRSTSMH